MSVRKPYTTRADRRASPPSSRALFRRRGEFIRGPRPQRRGILEININTEKVIASFENKGWRLREDPERALLGFIVLQERTGRDTAQLELYACTSEGLIDIAACWEPPPEA
jgi:hypothetical protein